MSARSNHLRRAGVRAAQHTAEQRTTPRCPLPECGMRIYQDPSNEWLCEIHGHTEQKKKGG